MALRCLIGFPSLALSFCRSEEREVLISTSSATPSSRQYPSIVPCTDGRRAGPRFWYSPSSHVQFCLVPSTNSTTVPLRPLQLRPPGRSRASSRVTSNPNFLASYAVDRPPMPPPMTTSDTPLPLPAAAAIGCATVAFIGINPRDCMVTNAAEYPPAWPTRVRNSRRESVIVYLLLLRYSS